jgi:asparagine synthase (glutamine-hydrolysing)
VYDEATSSDERNFIRCVEEKRGRVGRYLLDEDYPTLASFPNVSQLSFPDFLDCFAARHKGLCEAMRADGARVLLTGHGGDEMLYSSPIPSPGLGDMLVRCRLLQLHCSVKSWSKVLKRPYLELLWRDCVVPLLPLNVQIRCGLKSHLKLPFWLDAKFVARMNLRERHLGPADVFGFKLPSGRDQAIGFLSVTRVISKASYRARGCIEVSHPYLHRPLAEFLQAIPFEQRVRPGETRALMRRALRDILPEKVLKRRGNKGPDEALFRALARHWSQLRPIFENPLVCARGYMNAGALQAALERARHGCETRSFAVIQTISLEFWLRALELRGSTTKRAAQLEELVTQPVAAAPAAAHAVRQPCVHQGTL